ncbi:phospho-2-dehydro-3-deoxyheptonate aldolase [Streptomyces dysideae]|uniref:Phospho-2-dehydro-3-deoxyheptonate aldolase n=1 Tax=Streptomyces dysideae TaxID=909626 RepID=A0A101UR27_9ACTN|nr:phospho-2-dehydro-3-deoxyheptonate aldolase [Streptomyces dysideae]
MSGAALTASSWHPLAWRGLPIRQQPPWPDPDEVAAVTDRLALLPALTTTSDVRSVLAALARVQNREAFVLQGGDCAEPFGPEAVTGARAKHRVLGAVAERVSTRLDLPVVTVGRLAGQFAKPRSEPLEEVAGRELPVFRGLVVNGPEPHEDSRRPDAYRMLSGYYTAKNVLRELAVLAHETASSFAPQAWEPAAARELLWNGRGETAPDGSLRSLVQGYGQTRWSEGRGWRHTGLWTSHEALLLDYENPLTRRDPVTGEWFLLSTHLPWLGDRTRQVGGAHVEFLAGIANPVACKMGPTAEPDEIVRLCERLDPYRRPGRLTLICRMGARRLRQRLPAIVTAVRRAGHPVVWMSDPMHGNTTVTRAGVKTRHLRDMVDEVTDFFEVLRGMGEWPGGVHLEAAAAEVTECVGGTRVADESALADAYETLCDPRLNNEQLMAMADMVAKLAA